MKKIYIIPRDRQATLAPNYWNGISQSSPQTKKLHGVVLAKVFSQYTYDEKHPVMLMFYEQKQWYRAYNFLGQRLYRDRNYFYNVARQMSRAEKNINIFLKNIRKKNISNFNLSQIIKTAYHIKNLWLAYDIPNVPTWYWGGDKFKELLRSELTLPEKDFLSLTTPLTKTYASQLEQDLLTFAIKTNTKNLKYNSQYLSNRYGWIPYNYDGPIYWQPEYFAKQITRLQNIYTKKQLQTKLHFILEKQKNDLKNYKKIINIYNINTQHIKLINRLNQLAIWTDERKMNQYKLHFYYGQILHLLSKKFQISYLDLKYLFTEELELLSKNKSKIIHKLETRKYNSFITVFSKGKYKIIPDVQTKKIIKVLTAQMNQKKIIGQVACSGPQNTYRGRAKILFSAADGKKIKLGNFLITRMTTPDYILAMQKAAGFITNEGGVTCHAAIVAREMNKPCIIGTQVATRLLKDNDLIEVNTNTGEVKKI